MTTQSSRISFISEVQSAASDLLNAIDRLETLYARWVAGYSAWLVDPVAADEKAGVKASFGDFTTANGLTKEDLAAVLGTTLTALRELLKSGHRTNLEKIR